MTQHLAKPSGVILVADDERSFREHFSRLLQSQEYTTLLAATPDEIDTALVLNTGVDLVTLDLGWPEFRVTGIDLLRRVQAVDPLLPVIILTGDASVATAIEATRLGAFDYLEKVADQDRMLLTVRNAIAAGRLSRAARVAAEDRLSEYEIIGSSAAIENVRVAIRKFAPIDVPVLIEGETGCGKELVARQLHLQSTRASRAFRSVTATLLGSELGADALFGHTRGAFTGSVQERRGLLGATEGGTLCLDDIVTLPPAAQPLLLRFLESGEFYRLGSDDAVTSDVRILATSNVDIPKLIEEGRFRSDLYFRLKVATVTIPPLRDRREDIPLLAQHFIRKHSHKYLGHPVEIAAGAVDLFVERPWPGNVRELENSVIRLLLTHESPDGISEAEVAGVLDAAPAKERVALGRLRDMEVVFRRTCLVRALATTNGNVSKAAELLGIERTHLYRLINEYDLSPYVRQLTS